MSDVLQSVDNALRIMEAMSESEYELGIAELSRNLGLGRSTVHRLITTLESRGFVTQNPVTAKYKLGIKIVTIGGTILQKIDIIKEARPYLEKLSRATGESSHLALLSGDEIIFVDKVLGSNPAKMASVIGLRRPAYATATGKMLLAHLPEEQLKKWLNRVSIDRFTPFTLSNTDELSEQLEKIKGLGYSEDLQEMEEGLICFGAPIRNVSGEVFAAVSVSGAASRMISIKQELIVQVTKTADLISEACGWRNK